MQPCYKTSQFFRGWEDVSQNEMFIAAILMWGNGEYYTIEWKSKQVFY